MRESHPLLPLGPCSHSGQEELRVQTPGTKSQREGKAAGRIKRFTVGSAAFALAAGMAFAPAFGSESAHAAPGMGADRAGVAPAYQSAAKPAVKPALTPIPLDGLDENSAYIAQLFNNADWSEQVASMPTEWVQLRRFDKRVQGTFRGVVTQPASGDVSEQDAAPAAGVTVVGAYVNDWVAKGMDRFMLRNPGVRREAALAEQVRLLKQYEEITGKSGLAETKMTWTDDQGQYVLAFNGTFNKKPSEDKLIGEIAESAHDGCFTSALGNSICKAKERRKHVNFKYSMVFVGQAENTNLTWSSPALLPQYDLPNPGLTNVAWGAYGSYTVDFTLPAPEQPAEEPAPIAEPSGVPEPGEAAPGENEPGEELAPSEPETAEEAPGEAETTEEAPDEVAPTPEPTEPATSESAESAPSEDEPSEEAAPSEPAPSEADPTEEAPSESAPGEEAPAEPEPFPAPTDPFPEESDANEPVDETEMRPIDPPPPFSPGGFKRPPRLSPDLLDVPEWFRPGLFDPPHSSGPWGARPSVPQGHRPSAPLGNRPNVQQGHRPSAPLGNRPSAPLGRVPSAPQIQIPLAPGFPAEPAPMPLPETAPGRPLDPLPAVPLAPPVAPAPSAAPGPADVSPGEPEAPQPSEAPAPSQEDQTPEDSTEKGGGAGDAQPSGEAPLPGEQPGERGTDQGAGGGSIVPGSPNDPAGSDVPSIFEPFFPGSQGGDGSNPEARDGSAGDGERPAPVLDEHGNPIEPPAASDFGWVEHHGQQNRPQGPLGKVTPRTKEQAEAWDAEEAVGIPWVHRGTQTAGVVVAVVGLGMLGGVGLMVMRRGL